MKLSMEDASEPRPTGRILALDLGQRRIGLAVSDELRLTAQGLATLERSNLREDLSALAGLARRWNAALLLVGHPIKMSGEAGRQAQWVQHFADRLAAHARLPVKLWDERLSTMEATRVLKQSGISIEKRARAKDRLAAVLLLQNYLDHLAYLEAVREAEE
jgi:putative Holliday junction resolvase